MIRWMLGGVLVVALMVALAWGVSVLTIAMFNSMWKE